MKRIKSLFAIVIAVIMLMTSTTAFASINTPMTATEIAVGTPVYSNFSYGIIHTGPESYDIDYVDETDIYYSFTPQISDYYEFTLTGYENVPYSGGNYASPAVVVKDANGDSLDYISNNNVTNVTKGAVYLTAGQRYVVNVIDMGLCLSDLVSLPNDEIGFAQETLALTVVRHEHNFKVSEYKYYDGSKDTSYQCIYCSYYTSVYTPAAGSGESSFQYVSSATGSGFTSVKKTSISKLTAKKKGFTVKWKKPSNASGYQVQYATNKKMTKDKKTVTIKKSGTTTYTQNKLKAKKTYYVRVRAYAVVNGKKVYSDWTSPKSVKTK